MSAYPGVGELRRDGDARYGGDVRGRHPRGRHERPAIEHDGGRVVELVAEKPHHERAAREGVDEVDAREHGRLAQTSVPRHRHELRDGGRADERDGAAVGLVVRGDAPQRARAFRGVGPGPPEDTDPRFGHLVVLP